MISCSDYIFKYLKSIGVNDVFLLSGGGIMHLLDSLGKSGMRYICCHHEQACSIAAKAYALYGGKLGVCLVTTGPGGTNALTGAAAAFVDSTPVLFISGQVKRNDFAEKRGVRQYGAQENDIVSMAKPVTKYAVTVTNPDEIGCHLQKAVYMATNGRKGPVWIDIPLDVQSEAVSERSLMTYTPPPPPIYDIDAVFTIIPSLLISSKRPLILAGHGVIAANAENKLKEFVAKHQIPVMATWRALGVFNADDELFMGSPGLQAPRYSNFVLQSCDLLFILGSRLDNMITAFNEERFAVRAKKIMVDIDKAEINKLNTPDVISAVCDAGLFLDKLASSVSTKQLSDYSAWRAACLKIKNEFPIINEKQSVPGGVNLYKATDEISKHAKKDDVLVITSTSRCNTAGHIAFKHKAGQRLISSMGMGSMGFAVPSAIGAYYASGGSRVIVLEGDGSLQLNIQELQTLRTHNIPAKIFIFSNNGYAAIMTMQERNFDSRYIGSHPESGVELPDLSKIAAAYGIPYLRIDSDAGIEQTVREAMNTNGIVICDIIGSPKFDEIPKCISTVNADGKRVSANLENPYPFLPDGETERLIDQLIKQSAL